MIQQIVQLLYESSDNIQSFLGIGDYSQTRLGGTARSPLWSRTKREFYKIHPKKCSLIKCKPKLTDPKTLLIELHHVESFASRPEKENDLNNLMAFCRKHHQDLAHLGDFKSLNDQIREWVEKINHRPYWNGKEWINS